MLPPNSRGSRGLCSSSVRRGVRKEDKVCSPSELSLDREIT
jgi:hypothetical protein